MVRASAKMFGNLLWIFKFDLRMVSLQKIVIRDLDQPFEGHKLKIVISLKQ